MARRADRHEGQILTEDLPASNTDAVSGRDGLGVDDQWFDQVVVLAVSGSVDALTAPQLAVAISAALGSSPAGIIIDLSKADFFHCFSNNDVTLTSEGIAAAKIRNRSTGTTDVKTTGT